MQNSESLQATDHIHLNLLSYWMFVQNYQALIYIKGSSSKSLQCLKLLTVQFSSVVSDSATPWTAAHQASLSITNSWSLPKSCPLSQWCHPIISSSVLPFSSCPQSFPASGSFQMSQLFTWGGQSTGVSASTSVLPMNTQYWSPLGWTPCSQKDSQESSNTTVQKHQFFGAQLSSQSNSHIHTRRQEKP